LLKNTTRAPQRLKPVQIENSFIAALKRCATQNHCFSANFKGAVDFGAHMVRLKAAPFQNASNPVSFST
jgi:hypothetical protein